MNESHNLNTLTGEILLREIFHESWMDEEDWSEFKQLLFSRAGIGPDAIAEALEAGVRKGYGLEMQHDLVRQQFNK
jgi:hypothetical protein